MGMLLESSLDNNSTYHDIFGYNIKAKYDNSKFLSVWKHLTQKHELLRAAFISHDINGWNIIIYKNTEINYQIYKNQKSIELIATEKLNNFDYTKPGLFKLIVNDLDSSFDIVFSFHHAIEDGWSIASLVNEFVQAYINDKLDIHKPELCYGEFVKDELFAIKNQNNLVFWKEYLDGLNVVQSHWKFDIKKSSNSLYNISFDLSMEQVKVAHEIAREAKISIDSIFLLAYLETLAFFTNNSDITVGFVVNNRLEKDGGDRLFGPFLNTIPFRFNPSNYISDKNKLLAIFNTKLKLQKYKQLPYGYIKSSLGQELYDFAFNFVHFHILNESMNSIEFFSGHERTNIPFILNVVQHENSAFLLEICAHDDYIDKDFLDYFSLYYKECLVSILQESNSKLSLTKEDYKQIIHSWNETDKVFPTNKTIQSLFEEQVEKSPDSIAIIYEDIQLTYKSLNDQANQLANYLKQTHNIKPDRLIALCLDRNEHMLVAILAVLKSGGAYVPIDFSYPDERIKYILADTNTKLLLTSEVYRQRLEDMVNGSKNMLDTSISYSTNIIDKNNSRVEDKAIKILAIDNAVLQEKLQLQTTSNLKTKITDNNLAYVIYTSGTTGNPKGVMIEHNTYIRTIDCIKNIYFTNTEKIRTYSITNYVFDIFGLEYGLPLLSGGMVCIGTHEFNILDCSNYDFIQMTPSLCSLKLDYLMNTSNTTLFIGGEKLSHDLLSKILNKSINIINLYGPTETTIWSLSKSYSYIKDTNLLYVTLGKPFNNEKVYVLDKNLAPLPIGTIGELYIGGIGLARGYLNRADLTAELFIANPFQTKEENRKNKNTRLYKTGDLVRWLPDGNIEYIGRNDFQVKIRGYRIELGEIENALLSYEGIKQSVVLSKEYINTEATIENKSLIGYYVADNQLNNDNILNYLFSKLPEYMVPNILVYLEKMPLTINGKLDRKALPQSEFANSGTYIAPSNEIENKMCQIWMEVLGLSEDKIGTQDDFFRLGSNSIMAIRLLNKLNKELNINISISDIFKHSTIRKLTHYLKYRTEVNVVIDKAITIKPEEQSLSFAQERLWFIERYEGGSNAYNIPIVFRLSNSIALNILENSIKSIVNRHGILRTIIREDIEGNSYQLILDDTKYPLEITRINVINQLQLDQELEKQVNHIYNLNNEYPIKICLYELTNTEDHAEYYLSIVIHHIAFDGWSMDIFLAELQEYYNYYLNLSQNIVTTLNLPNLTIQYKDFALWQKSYLNGTRLEKQLNYWKDKLSGYETLNLITDKLRPNQTNYTGHDVYFELDENISNALRDLAKELKVSLYSLLLSGYYLMLRSYSNQDDIAVGTPIANRHYNQIENLIGFFINSLVLRVKIDLKASIIDFIKFIGNEVIEGQLNQDLPFEKLVEELNIIKDTGRHPIFQVMFGVQSFGNILSLLGKQGIAQAEKKLMNLSSLLEEYVPPKNIYNIAQFDISTVIDDSKTKLKGRFNYAVSLYEEETISRFIESYTEILKQFVDLVNNKKKQEQSLSSLYYLSGKQYEKVIHQWNSTEQEYSKFKTIQQLFEEQVKESPDSIAVIYIKKRLTYRQLNERANQLAHYLKQNYNITPDTLIALCLDRSEHMLIAILAILKAGGAYVPIDPSYPEERIGYILEDTNTILVLTNMVHKDRLEDLSQTINSNNLGHLVNIINSDYRATRAINQQTKILAIDSKKVQKELSLQLIDNPKTETTSVNLAYVIYTSGTTGNPKGVMIEHKGIVNRIQWMNSMYPLNETDKILQKTPYTFDVSVWELLWANLYGACVVFAKPEDHKDAKSIIDLINEESITITHFVPSMLSVFEDTLSIDQERLNSSRSSQIPSLRYIFCSGEALNLTQVQKCHALLPNTEIHNLYGPTEASIDVLYYDCNNKDIATIYIGKPIDNTKVYVLDENLTPLPIGAIGELYVGGVGLARGYLNRADLTSERFIANPFLTEEEKKDNKNRRLYKTGDLVRWSSDGNIEYVGRNDFQVKIRGYRIELEEIENVLLSYAGIKQSVVLSKERTSTDESIDKYLVGYYVADNELNNEDILKSLSKRLPEYMVPSVLVHLDNLPLNINGKLDRKALPSPEFKNDDNYVAARSDLEREICNIWTEILGIEKERIGIHADFFKIGGNSILAIRLITKLNNYYKSHLKVSDIFVYKDIESISYRIIQTRFDYQAIVKLNSSYDKPNMFMIHPGEGGCEYYTPLADALRMDFSCYGVDSYNLYNEIKIDQLHELAKYYLAHIDRVMKNTNQETYYLLGWCLGGMIALEIASILEKRGSYKINVYLLDTVLHDEYLSNTIKEIDMAKIIETKNHYRNYLISQQYEEQYIEKMMSIIDIEVNLTSQQISSTLTNTKIILFKAMLEDTTFITENSKKFYEHVYNLKYNNVDKILEKEAKIQLVKLSETHHGNILLQEQVLVSRIRESH